METIIHCNPKAVTPRRPAGTGERLAVCSWSLQPDHPAQLVERLAATAIRRVQLSLNQLHEKPEIWGGTEALFREHGITVVSGRVGCRGEDYTTLESIRLTGGIVPEATWEDNQQTFQACAAIAARLGLKLVTFHAGFLPPDESSAAYQKIVRRLKAVADIFRKREISLGLETGQETAPALAQLLRRLEPSRVGVNFDPANMLLYDKGNPVEALRTLAPWILQIHVKDARRTTIPGTWGQEVPVGQGEVNWSEFFAAYKQARLDVNLVIEREQGNARVADVRTARQVVEQCLASR